MKQMPVIVVTGVLVKNDHDQYLLCKKPSGVGPYPGMWLTPGGGLDENESLDECARREVFEETGVTVRNLQRIYFDDFVTKNWRGNVVHFVAVLYTADYETGTLGSQPGDDDVMAEIRWFKADELSQLPLNPPLKRFLTSLQLI